LSAAALTGSRLETVSQKYSFDAVRWGGVYECVCVCVFYTSITPARSTRYRVRGGPRSLTTIIVIIIVFGSSRVARLCACRISGVVLHVAPHNARDSVCHTFRRIIISYTYSISRLARVHHHIHTHTHTHMLAQPILSRKFRHWNINRSPRGFFFIARFSIKHFSNICNDRYSVSLLQYNIYIIYICVYLCVMQIKPIIYLQVCILCIHKRN